MRRLVWVLVVALFAWRGSAEEGALPRGLGFRTVGQAETAAQVREDLRYVGVGIEDTSFTPGLKMKLSALLGTADGALGAAAGAEEGARIRDRVEKEAAAVLTAEQREELRRRTLIAFVELLMLTNGFSARDVDGDVVAAFGLSAEQATKIRWLLDQLGSNGGGNPGKFGAVAEARRAMRAVLTLKQREMLDEKIEAGVKAAGAESATTRESAPGGEGAHLRSGTAGSAWP